MDIYIYICIYIDRCIVSSKQRQTMMVTRVLMTDCNGALVLRREHYSGLEYYTVFFDLQFSRGTEEAPA